jgi:hypothetical protein
MLVFSKIDKDFYSTEMEVFSTGTHNGDKYKNKDLDAMIEAFNTLKNKWKPTLKIGHGKQLAEQPALGYVDKLKRVGNTLIAKIVNIPKIVKDVIEKGLYKKRSAEIYWNYKDGNKVWSRCLKAIALLGESIPAVSSLKDVEKFFDEGYGDIKLYESDFEFIDEEGYEDYANKIDHKGKNNPNWKDGSAPGYYRKYLEKHPICEQCKKNKAVMVHHKDGDRKNNEDSNFEALCYSCHMKSHKGQWEKDHIDLINLIEEGEVKDYTYWSDELKQDRIRARVRSMDLFDYTTLKESKFKGKDGVSLVMGSLNEDSDNSVIQSWLFDRKIWTIRTAQEWLEGYSIPSPIYSSYAKITKSEDGIEFPKEAYLYIPDSEKSSTWKLRIWEDLDKKVTRVQLGRAAAAFSPGGFRGQKVQLPSGDIKKVKDKLKSLYKKLGVKDDEIPKYLDEDKEAKTMDWEAKLREAQDKIDKLNQKIADFEAQKKTNEVKELKEQLREKTEELEEMKVFKEEADKLKVERDEAISGKKISDDKVDAINKERRTDSILTFVKDNGVNGTKKILPRDEKLVVDILGACPQEKKYKLDDKDVSLEDMVKTFIKGLPEMVDTSQHSRKDKDGDADTAKKELEGKIVEYRKEHPAMTYTEAFDAVIKSDPDLKERYHKETM